MPNTGLYTVFSQVQYICDSEGLESDTHIIRSASESPKSVLQNDILLRGFGCILKELWHFESKKSNKIENYNIFLTLRWW